MDLKDTRKELWVKDSVGKPVANITAEFDHEFNYWDATVSLAAFGRKSAEEAILALEADAQDVVRAIRGSRNIPQPGQPIHLPPLTRKLLKTFMATTFEAAEQMRVIRNTCRQFMTRDQKEISEEEQRKWFEGLDRREIVPLLSVLEEPINGFPAGHPVGYGISRLWEPANDKPLKVVTGGLLPELRGLGLGEELFRDVIVWAGIPCWLEVLSSNLSAIRLYQRLGFEVVGTKEREDYAYIIMRLATLPTPPENK